MLIRGNAATFASIKLMLDLWTANKLQLQLQLLGNRINLFWEYGKQLHYQYSHYYSYKTR